MATDDEKLPTTVASKSSASGGGLHGLDDVARAALNPAAEEFGNEIVPFGKKAGALTNRVGVLLLRSLEPLVYGLEKSGDWIEKAVTERLSNIASEKIVPPNPRVAVPAMQALTYSMADETIREMFANLLAADMNSDKKAQAHPAFVELIKEMTPLDAKVLRIVHSGSQTAFLIRIGSIEKFVSHETRFSFVIEGASNVDVETSLNNLHRLGLLETKDFFPLSPEGDKIESSLVAEYEPAKLEFIKKHRELSDGQNVEVICHREGIYMSPLGGAFSEMCLLYNPSA